MGHKKNNREIDPENFMPREKRKKKQKGFKKRKKREKRNG